MIRPLLQRAGALLAAVGVLIPLVACGPRCTCRRSVNGDVIVLDDYVLVVLKPGSMMKLFGTDWRNGHYYFRCNVGTDENGSPALVSTPFYIAAQPPILRVSGSSWRKVSCALLDTTQRRRGWVTIYLPNGDVVLQPAESIGGREIRTYPDGRVDLM